MIIFNELTLIINILAIIVLLIGLFHKFENPKHKALYGYWITGTTIFYMIFLSLYIIKNLVINHDFYILGLFLCVVSPFVVGKLVKYETLKKYTLIQIICFCVSAVVLFLR